MAGMVLAVYGDDTGMIDVQCIYVIIRGEKITLRMI